MNVLEGVSGLMERFVLYLGGVGWVDVDGDVKIVNRGAGAEGDVGVELV